MTVQPGGVNDDAGPQPHLDRVGPGPPHICPARLPR